MRSSLLPLTLAVVLEAGLVAGVTLPFTVHHATRHPRLRTRADITADTNTTSDTGIPIKNTQNAFYLANITVSSIPSTRLP
jgi:hypothetical protein